MATSKKLTVVNSAVPIMPTIAPAAPVASASTAGGLFNYWGNQADNAFGQGWRPTESGNGYVRYKQTYNAPFNDVYIPETPNERGSIQVIGRNGNKMDIVIADKQGNIRHTIHQNVTPEFVQDYTRNAASTIAQRVDNMKKKRLSVIAMK